MPLLEESHIDIDKYWEKRRIQNGLRRLFEALQELFGLQGDCQATDYSRFWEAIVSHAEKLHRLSIPQQQQQQQQQQQGLAEWQACNALEVLGAWPPELRADDKTEIFSALLVPSWAAAREIASGRQALRTVLTREAFCDGLDRVPFNLPEFPVPTHLLPSAATPPSQRGFGSEELESVAK